MKRALLSIVSAVSLFALSVVPASATGLIVKCNGHFPTGEETSEVIDGVYTVMGTGDDDTIIINLNVLNSADYIYVEAGSGNDNICITGDVLPDWLPDGSIPKSSTYVYGESGNDYINAGAWSIFAVGDGLYDNQTTPTGGNDTLIGSPVYQNSLFGNGGNDRIIGGGSDDSIQSGAGNDTVNGGGGADNISGGTGSDKIYGDDGYDVISGGSGNDILEGGLEGDAIYGNKGNDIVKGGDGSDFLIAGEGNDKLYGGNDNDVLQGEAGNDKLYGQSGINYLTGGLGKDYFYSSSIDKITDYNKKYDKRIRK